MYRTLSAVCVLVFLLSGCSGKYKTKEELLSEGTKLLNTGNPGGAIVLMKNALDKDQNYFEARLVLARAYQTVGKADSAEKELQKLHRQRPDSRDVHIEMAKLYVGKSQPDEALKELDGIVDDQADAEAQEVAAWAHDIKGEHATALAMLGRTLATYPDRVTTSLTLARVYYRMGNIDGAKAQLTAILEKDQGNRAALYFLAELHLVQRNFDEAIRTFDQLLAADSSDMEALYRKGVLFLQKGRFDDALAAALTIIKRTPNRPEGHRLQGMAYLHKKAFGEAIISLQKSLAMKPHVSAYYYIALSHYNRDEYEQAVGQLQKALDLMPSFTQGRTLLATIYLKKNRIEDAVSEAKKALEGNDEDALVHNILGSAYVAQGMFNEGIAELNKALSLDPKLVDARLKKGVINIRTGKPGEAEAEFTTALRINPDLLSSRLMLATYYLNQGAYDKAEQVAREGLKGEKTDAALYNLMAESSLRRRQADDAVAAFRKAKAANPEDDHAYFKLAAIDMAKGEPEKGIQEFKSLIEKSPGNTRALLILASLLEARGNKAEALTYYVRARETGKPEGFIEEARYHLRNKDADRAVSVLSDAIRKHPALAGLYEMKGKVLLSQKQYREAYRAFEALEQVDAKLGFASLVDACLVAGDFDKALDRVNRQVRKEPGRAEHRAEISRIYLAMGKKQEALENALQTVRSHPEQAAGHQALAAVYVKSGEVDKGIEALKNAGLRDAGLSVMLGNLYVMRKNYAAALDQYRNAETIKIGYVPAMFQKGAVLHSIGKKKEAAAEYERVLKIAPNYVPALNNIAYLYADDSEDLTFALQYAFRAFLLAPRDGPVNDTLGYVLLKRGRVDEGMKILKQAAELMPDNSSVHYHLALAYERNNKQALAVESLQRAIDLGNFPDETSARTLIAKLKKDKRS